MLVSSGAEPVRSVCIYRYPEIEELTDYIGSQRIPDAMHLPEYIDDSEAEYRD